MTDKHGVGTFVNEAHELATDALDLFSVPQYEEALVHGKELTLYPTSVLLSEGPIEFLIPSDSSDFTQLNLTRLYGEIDITKADGTTQLTAADKISVVNLFPQSLWKQIECSINGTQICDLSTPTYHYKSFIETHLSHPKDVKETTLKDLSFYIKDDAGVEESKLLADAAGEGGAKANKGFVSRKAFIQGQTLCFSIILHIDFFQCHKLLLPGCDIKLKLIRADDNFSFISEGVDAKIKIKKLQLKIRRLTADSKIIAAIESKLNSTPAIYPICKSVIKSHLLNNGTKNHHISQFVRGKLPRSFILCFVNAKAYDSNRAYNPFLFANNSLNHLNVFINGEPLTSHPFQPNFTTEEYAREYRWFLDNIGLQHTGSNGISKAEFKANSCFFPFDLSPDLCNSVYLHGTENGTIDLDIGFQQAPTENIYCLMYASYDELITIDKNRNVQMT
jgi:hypothetical protein